MDLKKKPRLRGAGLKEISTTDSGQGSKLQTTLASEEEGLASLLDRAAAVIAKNIYSSHFTSPEVHAVEEGLRVLFEDAAGHHRFLSATVGKERRSA